MSKNNIPKEAKHLFVLSMKIVTSYYNVKMLQNSGKIHILENTNFKLQNSLHVFDRDEGNENCRPVPYPALACGLCLLIWNLNAGK